MRHEPRAAWRLERLGFHSVYDYAPGKVDWMAAGLPTVRPDSSERRALDVADRHPPTCSPDTLLRDLPDARGVIVVNDQDIVLGRVRTGSSSDRNGTAEGSMSLGPATVRAHEPLDPLIERMRHRDVTEIIVTTPEGRLLGVVRRQ